MSDRQLGWALHLLATLMIACVVHIVTILGLPHVAIRDSYARIASVAPINRLTALPEPMPGAELLPLQDPALARGACRFDLSAGPVRVRADVTGLDGLLTLSFHDRRGGSFYATTDRGALRGSIDILLLTRDQLTALEALDLEDEIPQELRLLAPTREGFVLAGSLALDPGDLDAARKRLALLSCVRELRR
jgi:uncharacterized membrane protein